MTHSNEPQRVPEPKLPKKRRSAASRVIASLFLLAILATVAAGAAGFYAYQEYTLPGPLADAKIIEIGKGKSTPEIAAQLEDEGIISDARVFSTMAYVTGNRSRLKAGEYEFARDMPMRDVLALIASGKSITYKISIPEGWTSDMAVSRVLANEVLTGEVTSPPPEGSIMPDTYVFKRGMTRQKLLDDMQAAQVKLLEEIWATRSPSLTLRTKEEAVILASIVEKETGVAEERPVIASVFLNRLQKGMRLQSDPTIIYGITGGKGKLDRPLTRTDIRTPTPYNTYTIDGLPPGPIANPGRAALEAVTQPPSTEYLYFVADGSGGHAFATTLEDHNRNVADWRKKSRDTASAAAEDTAGSETPPAADAPAATAPAEASEPAAAESDAQALPDIDAPPPGPAETPDPATTEAPPVPAGTAPAEAAPVEAAPVETPSIGTPPVAAETPPKPKAKPSQPAVEAAAPEAEAPAEPEPGSVLTVKGKLVAIPKTKPQR